MSGFEVRGADVYPTWDNDRYEYSSSPVFEIRGTDIHPTIHNEHYEYTSDVAFEIRDGYAYPTYLNDDDDGFSVDDRGPADGGAGDWSLAEAALALGAVGAIWAGSRAWERRKNSKKSGAAPQFASPPPMPVSSHPAAGQYAGAPPPNAWPPLAPTPQPGWYPTPYGLRFWNGSSWVGPVHPSAGEVPVVTVPPTPVGLLLASWIVTILTMGYMLPWAIAVTRRTENRAVVGWLCLLLGWTIVGWLVPLGMACSGRQRGPSMVAPGGYRPPRR